MAHWAVWRVNLAPKLLPVEWKFSTILQLPFCRGKGYFLFPRLVDLSREELQNWLLLHILAHMCVCTSISIPFRINLSLSTFGLYNFSSKIKSGGIKRGEGKEKKEREGNLEGENEKSSLDETKRDCTKRRRRRERKKERKKDTGGEERKKRNERVLARKEKREEGPLAPGSAWRKRGRDKWVKLEGRKGSDLCKAPCPFEIGVRGGRGRQEKKRITEQ